MENTRTRYQYFLDEVDFDEILRSYISKEFNEYVISIGGDVCTFRVYGDGDYNYFICEK